MARKKESIDDKILTELKNANLTEQERDRLYKAIKHPDTSARTFDHSISSNRHRFMVISDSHIGHKDFKPEILQHAFAYAKKFKPEAIYHPGDVVEGMSGRPGHIYELTHIGATPQVNYAAELLADTPVKIFAITGNHDQWYYNKANGGLDVGEQLQDKLGKDKFEYLGMNEADIMLTPNVRMKMFHPNDGTAYAQSYKLQKLIESFTGGDKPNVVFEGHYHKALYMFTRNVHGFESGTLCGQTPFMRGKKIPAHMGFWAVEITYDKAGKQIDSIRPEFVAHYE